MNAWGLTDKGIGRQENQDSFFVVLMQETNQAIMVVCDGMGGAKAGNVASKMAVDNFVEEVKKHLKPDLNTKQISNLLEDAVYFTNGIVNRMSKHEPGYRGMGTTLVGAVACGKSISVANVGDSRAYIVGANGITKITRDHSLVEDMLLSGEITKEQAKVHPGRNLITRAVGTSHVVKSDIYSFELADNEYLLLCSDGLTNVVTEEEIYHEIMHGNDISTCCQRLIDKANDRGAPDNVTVVIYKN